MKRNKKVMAILMVMMFGLSFLLPGLISPWVAEAASTYSVLSIPTVQANAPGQSLGIIQVDVPNCTAITQGDGLTLSLPAGVELAASGPAVITNGTFPAGPNQTGVEVLIPQLDGGQNGLPPFIATAGPTRTSLELTFAEPGLPGPGRLLIYITGASIGSISGDIVAQLLAPANSAFSSGLVIVGRVGIVGTAANIPSVKTIGPSGGNIDVISIAETAPGTVRPDDVIKIKLPNGFSWGTAEGIQAWAWAGAPPMVEIDSGDKQILNIMINGPNVPSLTGGRVDIASFINVDEAVATAGEVVAHIYDTSGRVTETDLVVARYGQIIDTYQTLSVPTIHANSFSNLGVIEVNIPSASEIVSGDVLTVSLPEKIALPGASAGYSSEALLTWGANEPLGSSGAVEVFVPLNPIEGTANGFTPAVAEGTVTIEPGRNTLHINFNAAGGNEAGQLFIYLRGAAIGAISEDVTANIASTSAVLPAGSLVVARFSNLAPPANTTYKALNSPMVSKNAPGQSLGIIQIDVSNCMAITPGDGLTLSLPAGVELAASGPAAVTDGTFPAGLNETGVEVLIPQLDGGPNGLPPVIAMVGPTRTSLELTFLEPGLPQPGRLLIYMTGAFVGSIDGDLVAHLQGPANSAFSSGSVLVGRVCTAGTIAHIQSVKTIGPNGGAIDVISIAETAPGTVVPGNVIKIKLPAGFSWRWAEGRQAWEWAGAPPRVEPDPFDNRILNVIVNGPNIPSITTGGRVDIGGEIWVDSSEASFGDVVAQIYDTQGDITATDLLVARYTTYGVNIFAESQPELLAGKAEQKMGTFCLEETLAGSLIAGRNISLTLPEGVKWWNGYFNGLPAVNIERGNIALSSYMLKDDGRTLETNIMAGSTVASKISFKDLKVDVAPDFYGPLVITVGGLAGASGEVAAGNVNPAVTFCSSITHIEKDKQNQLLGDILIYESRPGSIADSTNPMWNGYGMITPLKSVLYLKLPAGALWSEDIPVIEVISGDLQLDLGAVAICERVIEIPVKYSSTRASTVKISGLKATLSTTVPDGAFMITLDGTAINETGGYNLPFPVYTAGQVMLAGVGSNNADLSGLIVDGKEIENFASDVDIYYVALPLDTSAVPNVEAVAADSEAVIDIIPAYSLEGSEEERTAIITVRAPDGISIRTYYVVFSLTAPGNADLTDLKVDGMSIAGFNPEVTCYNVKLAVGTTTVPTVTATAWDEDAVLNITPALNLNGTAAERTTTVRVTPSYGPEKIYQITFWVARDYLEKQLPAGWNILSAPLQLERSGLADIVTDPAKILLAFRYNSSTSSWAEMAGEDRLNPMDAICLKLSDASTAKLYPSTVISGPYSRTLTAGWNLFGPALDISSAPDSRMTIGRVLTAVDSSQYSQVVSPRMGNQYPWTYVPGDDSYPGVQAGEGYWIYMKEPAALAGFSYTPVEDVFYELPASGHRLLAAASFTSEGVPGLPAAFMGTVKDKAGNPIAQGKIEVVMDGVVRASKAFTDGQFGLSLGERLIVEKMYYDNAAHITFNVNGYSAVANTPVEWSQAGGNLTRLDLVVDTEVPEMLYYKTVALTSPNVVELSFSKEFKSNLADLAALKQAVSYSADQGNFSPLAEADTVSIEGNKLIIRFASALRGHDNQLRIEAQALSDLDGNVIAEPIETASFSAQVVDECFIATASFGSKFEPSVVLLRAFRDQYLLTNTFGTDFVKFYYRHSPPIAAYIADSEPLKAMVRILLLPFIAVVYLIYHPFLAAIIILGVFALLLRRRTQRLGLRA